MSASSVGVDIRELPLPCPSIAVQQGSGLALPDRVGNVRKFPRNITYGTGGGTLCRMTFPRPGDDW